MLSNIQYGDGFIPVELPDHARIIRPPEQKPGIADVEQAVRDAIANPINHDPIHKLVGAKARVAIAFDDMGGPDFPVEGKDFRQIAIEVLLEELDRAGVNRNDITLICAQALHHKLSRTEMEVFLGQKLVLSFGYNNLYCHDAEDPDQLVHLGYTKRGFDVEVNRLVVESDLFIYLNITQTPFSGGWKSTAVGLGTFRSIRHHHRPWPIASGQSTLDFGKSAFHKLLWEQGGVIADRLAQDGKRVFQIEAAYSSSTPVRCLGVWAGTPAEAHLPTIEAVNSAIVTEVEGQADIGVIGVGNTEFYSRLTRINPILVTQDGLAYGAMQFQNVPLVRDGGIVILANPYSSSFDPRRFGPYIEFWEKLMPQSIDAYWLWENYIDDFTHRREYIDGYRYRGAYHPGHPFFMWNSTVVPRLKFSAILGGGVRDEEAARRCGIEPFPTVEAAIEEARNRLGRDASISVLERPPNFIPRISPSMNSTVH